LSVEVYIIKFSTFPQMRPPKGCGYNSMQESMT
jgi:hypothetical protein